MRAWRWTHEERIFSYDPCTPFELFSAVPSRRYLGEVHRGSRPACAVEASIAMSLRYWRPLSWSSKVSVASAKHGASPRRDDQCNSMTSAVPTTTRFWHTLPSPRTLGCSRSFSPSLSSAEEGPPEHPARDSSNSNEPHQIDDKHFSYDNTYNRALLPSPAFRQNTSRSLMSGRCSRRKDCWLGTAGETKIRSGHASLHF